MTTEPKAAIITGASKGIGAAIAVRLASDGHAIIINYARDIAAAEGIVAKIVSGGGQAKAVQGDVADPKTATALFDAAEAHYGCVDILVSNAGTMKNAPISGATDSDFDKHCAVNFGGTFRGMREAAKRLRVGGRIISVSSSVVGLYQPNYGLYAATKAAVEAMTPVLAKELGPRGITVNAVAPGPVGTDFFLDGKSEELIQNITKSIPLGRIGAADDVASVVSFLAGQDSGWVNGQTIRANGGVI